MKSEKEKMLAGELYYSNDPQLVELRGAAKERLHSFNFSPPSATIERNEIVERLFGAVGAGFEISQPFLCDYGFNIFAGKRLYTNFGCVILDCSRVEIGDDVFIAPNVHIYTAHHPIDPDTRRTGIETATPVKIGSDVWLGGGAIICPGVTVGDGTTIGAGSVVTRDIPPRVLAVGNPCRVIRQI